jgi:hypothetical protein
MIKDLIKLANELDKIGLHEHSDKIDRKIRQLSKEAGITDPTPGSTGWQLALDLARQVSPVPSVVESLYDITHGKGVYESFMPHVLRSVEDYKERKVHILAEANSSLKTNKLAVQAESATLNAGEIIAKIKEKVESLDEFFGGSWTMSNYYRNMETVAPEVHKLSYALGYKGEPLPSKGSVGLSSVVPNLSPRTTSYWERDYREAGRWILWEVISDGYSQGAADKTSAVTPAPPAPVTPPVTPPGPTPAPPLRVPLIPLRHPENTILSGPDAGGWYYKVTGQHSFEWKSPAKIEGSFTGTTQNAGKWNKAATIINSLNPDAAGENTAPPSVPPSTSTPQPSNTKNNVEIILSRVSAGANFSLGTAQNEKRRLKKLIENGMTIPEIAEEVLIQHGTALDGLPLTTDKTAEVNKIPDSEMKKKYKTEIDLIMSTINRIFNSKK